MRESMFGCFIHKYAALRYTRFTGKMLDQLDASIIEICFH